MLLFTVCNNAENHPIVKVNIRAIKLQTVDTKGQIKFKTDKSKLIHRNDISNCSFIDCTQ